MLTSKTRSSINLDLLTADVQTLQIHLQEGRLKSVDLVDMHLEMIQKHDGYLKAMLSLVPKQRLRQISEALDQERSEGKLRGPLHGIPIVIKDNIATHPRMGMKTTCGSLALEDMRPCANARLVDKLIQAGLIIIGKANLSEWSYFRSYVMPSAWSALGSQGQSAYVRGGVDPTDSKDGHSSASGSSSGPAVAVSAGYAPLSIGTDTDGSLTCPAGRAALYTIKPTIGIVSQDGIIPVSHTMDSAGPMGKTPYDIAVLLDVIREPGVSSQGNFVSLLEGSWADLSIATVSYKTWWLEEDCLKPVESATKQMHTEIQGAYDKMKKLAKKYVENVPLVSTSEYIIDGHDSEWRVLLADFKKDIDKYLDSVEHCQVRSLEQLITFNDEHKDVELPPPYDDQDVFLDSLKLDLSPEDYSMYLTHMRKVATQGLDDIFSKYGVDVIIGPCDSPLSSLSSGSGYPMAAMPLGYADLNGRPFGLMALAGKHQEAKLFQLMNAWEGTFGPRKPPPLL